MKQYIELINRLKKYCNYIVSFRGYRWTKVDIFDLQECINTIESLVAENQKATELYQTMSIYIALCNKNFGAKSDAPITSEAVIAQFQQKIEESK